MKFWGTIVLALGAGCASAARPVAAPLGGSGGREFVERLRVEADWHPAPTGGECVTTWHELPRGSYIAQGWGWTEACYRAKPVYWRRGCRPLRACD